LHQKNEEIIVIEIKKIPTMEPITPLVLLLLLDNKHNGVDYLFFYCCNYLLIFVVCFDLFVHICVVKLEATWNQYAQMKPDSDKHIRTSR
jgi:hypothetical protein